MTTKFSKHGEVAEWSNAAVSKDAKSINRSKA